MSSGLAPDFDASPARLTWTSAGTSSLRAAESESSECTSSQIRFRTFTLFDWRWPMKCQRNASPYSACFASRSCARFSPTTVMPASTSLAMSGRSTYFVAATIVTSGPTTERTCSKRSRIASGDSTDHSLDTAGVPVAPMREEELRMVVRAEVDALDVLDASRTQGAFRRAPQVEVPIDGQVVVEETGHLRPDLVAARADRGPDHGRLRALAEAGHAVRDHAFAQPAPARVQNGDRARLVRADNRDRQAVRGHREHRQLHLVRPQAVTGLAACARVRAVHRRRMPLAVEREPLRRQTERLARKATVLLDLRRVVARAARQVQRRIDAVADAADAGRERDDVSRLVPDDHAATRQPSIGSRTAISSAAPLQSIASPRR